MFIKNIFFQICLLLAIILSKKLFAQNPDQLKIDKSLSILNGKAFFKFPAIASINQRGIGLMSANPNDNEETRVILDFNNMKLVFFAQELYCIATQNLQAEVYEQNKMLQFQTKVISSKDSLLSILSIPNQFDSSKNAILLNSLLVKMPDNSLFRINAYIDPSGLKLKNKFQKLTETIYTTLSKGTRRTNLLARTEKATILGTNKKLKFKLPANYVLTSNQGFDFQVFKIHKMQVLSDTNWVQTTLYFGNQPAYIYEDFDVTEKEAQIIKGSMLGKNMEWMCFDINKEGVFDKEQIITVNQIKGNLKMHCSILSNQKKLIDELTAILENVELLE